MADKDVSDLIMKFRGPQGLIEAEAGTDLTLSQQHKHLWLTQSKSPLAKGFVNGKMFEVQEFKLSTGLGTESMDEMKESAKTAKAMAEQKQALMNQHSLLAAHHEALGAVLQHANLPGMSTSPKDLKLSQSGAYSKFLKGENAHYPVDLKPVEFTRAIDKSSPTMLQHCIARTVFKEASLIKRRPTGGDRSGEVFLRLDFEDVLLTSIDWSDGEPIKETCEFVCRKLTIQYLPQLPDGTLGGVKQASWDARSGTKDG